MNTISALSTDEETATAAAEMARVRPQWRSLGRAASLVGLERDVLLHAGPPLKSQDRMCKPLLNAACAALIFEGLATDAKQAQALIHSGAVTLQAAQDRGVVTPLAAVVSSSMWLHEVVDAENSALAAYAPLNEGSGPALRFGLLTAEVVERLHFVHGELAPALARVMREDVDLLEIAAAGLSQGDELHARVGVGSKLLSRHVRHFGLAATHLAFLDANVQWFLNLWMGACACMMSAARRYGRGAVLIAAGGNGDEFGIQVASAPGRWVAAAVEEPKGPSLSDETMSCVRLPAIGDSAVIDATGFGALALDTAPEHAKRFDQPCLDSMAKASASLLRAAHPILGRRVGLDVSSVTAENLPGVCLAALDAQGEMGIVGPGIARHPAAFYEGIGDDLKR